ncbi:MAG TPA: glycoside hydrolase family 88 protein [Opitutaceae bacterium]|jgi:rhamnogalacturonyl hydrolase YesR
MKILLLFLAAAASALADDATQIRQILTLVSRHQICPLSDGDYTPVTTAAGLKAARQPEGIQWIYPWGVMLYGSLRSTDITRDPDVLNFVQTHNRIAAADYDFLSREQSAIGPDALKGFRPELFRLLQLGSLDNCGAMGTEMLDGMMRDPEHVTPGERRVVERVADWIQHRQDRLPDGTFWRPHTNGGAEPWKPGTIWADDLYMSCPFLVHWAAYRGDPAALDDAARQILQMAARLQDRDGIWFHAYFVNEHRHSPIKWGRANGWAVVSEVEVLSALPENDPLRAPLLAVLRRHLEGLKPLQAPDGLWRQVLDHPELWEETSCSAMFAYGFARAANRGWIDRSNLEIARQAFAGLETRITPEGIVNGTCAGTSIGIDLAFYRDRPRPSDDPHGPGVVLLAGSEILAAPAGTP